MAIEEPPGPVVPAAPVPAVTLTFSRVSAAPVSRTPIEDPPAVVAVAAVMAKSSMMVPVADAERLSGTAFAAAVRLVLLADAYTQVEQLRPPYRVTGADMLSRRRHLS
jgi:hypothetical protein